MKCDFTYRHFQFRKENKSLTHRWSSNHRFDNLCKPLALKSFVYIFWRLSSKSNLIAFVFLGETDKPSQIAWITVRHPHNFPPFFIFKASSSSHRCILWGGFSVERFLYFCLVLTFYLFSSVTRLYMQAPRGATGCVRTCQMVRVRVREITCFCVCVFLPGSLRSFWLFWWAQPKSVL